MLKKMCLDASPMAHKIMRQVFAKMGVIGLCDMPFEPNRVRAPLGRLLRGD